jgi:hypothetical protein
LVLVSVVGGNQTSQTLYRDRDISPILQKPQFHLLAPVSGWYDTTPAPASECTLYAIILLLDGAVEQAEKRRKKDKWSPPPRAPRNSASTGWWPLAHWCAV